MPRSARPIERRTHLFGKPAAHAPRPAGEGVVGDCGKPDLVAPQREQKVRDPVRGRQLPVGRRHAEAVDASRLRLEQDPAGFTEQPRPELPLPSTSPVSRCRSRASWPSMSARKPCATGSARSCRSPLRRSTLAPRNACSSGTIQACARLAAATGAASGWTRISATAATMNGIDQTTVQSVHSRPQRCSRSPSIGLRHGTAASSGRAALATR
jgi:hypothetical protein